VEAGATRLRLLAGIALLEHYIRLQLAVRSDHRSKCQAPRCPDLRGPIRRR
jgi:hypothetical protein